MTKLSTTSSILEVCPAQFPSPRPSPLQKGRGRIVRRHHANLRLRTTLRPLEQAAIPNGCSLAPAEGERVRVRGKGPPTSFRIDSTTG